MKKVCVFMLALMGVVAAGEGQEKPLTDAEIMSALMESMSKPIATLERKVKAKKTEPKKTEPKKELKLMPVKKVPKNLSDKQLMELLEASLLKKPEKPEKKIEKPEKPGEEDNNGHFVFEGHSYKVFTSKLRWHKARDACKEMGGNLVRIDSKAENDFIFKIIGKKKYVGYCYWIDLSDVKKEGSWVHSDGSKPKYINWGGGQQDNYNVKENHARIRSTTNKYYDGAMVVKAGTWEDWANHPYRYICEWNTRNPKYEEPKEEVVVKKDTPVVKRDTRKSRKKRSGGYRPGGGRTGGGLPIIH